MGWLFDRPNSAFPVASRAQPTIKHWTRAKSRTTAICSDTAHVILSRIDGDVTKVGELDDAVLNVDISYCLAVPENHTPVPEGMEVSTRVFQRRTIFTSGSVCNASA